MKAKFLDLDLSLVVPDEKPEGEGSVATGEAIGLVVQNPVGE